MATYFAVSGGEYPGLEDQFETLGELLSAYKESWDDGYAESLLFLRVSGDGIVEEIDFAEELAERLQAEPIVHQEEGWTTVQLGNLTVKVPEGTTAEQIQDAVAVACS